MVEVCQSSSQSGLGALAILTGRVRYFCRMSTSAYSLPAPCLRSCTGARKTALGRSMSVEAVTLTNEDAARRRIGVTAALAALVGLLVLISLGIGPVRLSPLAVAEALFGGGSDVAQVIVREIRLPRTILALAIGAILGLSGASLQGLLRNPLASPSLFGAPQSAAFGAVLVIALGLADVRSYALPVVAGYAAFCSVFVLLTIAGRNAGLLILILAGLAISSPSGSSTPLVFDLSRQPPFVLQNPLPP